MGHKLTLEMRIEDDVYTQRIPDSLTIKELNIKLLKLHKQKTGKDVNLAGLQDSKGKLLDANGKVRDELEDGDVVKATVISNEDITEDRQRQTDRPERQLYRSKDFVDPENDSANDSYTNEDDINDWSNQFVKDIFVKIDKSEDGFLTRDELWLFIKAVDCPQLQRMTMDQFEDQVFSRCMAAKRGLFIGKFSLSDFNEFLDEITMAAFFEEADLDGDGYITFEEMIKACAKNGFDLGLSELDVVNILFKKQDLSLEEMNENFRNVMTSANFDKMTKRVLSNLEDKVIKSKNGNKLIMKVCEAVNKMHGPGLENQHWDGFKGFKREVQGKLVMQSPNEIVADILPGTFTKKSLQATLAQNLLTVEPKHVAVQNVKWIKAQGVGTKSGRLLFQTTFKGDLPVQHATNELLSYYNASFLKSSQKSKFNRSTSVITLPLRHVIQDFTYDKDYLRDYVLNAKNKGGNGGAGLERHDFYHFDHPLQDDSGVFVIGKFSGEGESELHLSGFIIPPLHTLVLPGGVIHSNDYLKGTWRTMLSDAGSPIDHVHLHRGTEEDSATFHFSFV